MPTARSENPPTVLPHGLPRGGRRWRRRCRAEGVGRARSSVAARRSGSRTRALPFSRRSGRCCRARRLRFVLPPAGRAARLLPTRAEDNRISLVPIVPNRGHRRPQRRRAGAQLFGLHAGDHAVEGRRPRRHHRRPGEADRIQPKDRKRFRKLLDESKTFESLPIRTRLSDEEVARFRPPLPLSRRRGQGAPVPPVSRAIASHAIGYIGRINERDLEIIEERSRRQLQGHRPHRQDRPGAALRVRAARRNRLREVEIDAGGRAVRSLSRTAAGAGQQPDADLDIKLQEIAEKAFGDRRGALVAIEPSTGGILALVSTPTFDPNLFVDGIDTEDWEELNNSPDKPMVNRALNGAYPPGSTFKPFMALARWKWASARPGRRFPTPASSTSAATLPRRQEGRPRQRRHVQVHRPFLRHLLLHAGQRHGHRRIAKLHGPARLRQRTGIDIEGESKACCRRRNGRSSASRSPGAAEVVAGETISIGIGQGYNAYTPIQLAQATATWPTTA
jgi:penicillin-binding protein 2